MQEPGSVTMGINNGTPVAADSYDIVGRYVIVAVVHGFWATVPPRTTAGQRATSGRRLGPARVRPVCFKGATGRPLVRP